MPCDTICDTTHGRTDGRRRLGSQYPEWTKSLRLKTLKKAAKKAAKKPVAMKQAAKKTHKKAAKKPAAKKPAVRLLFPIASVIVHFYF